MSKDPHFIENENSLVKCCKQVSLWDTSRVAALLMKTSVIIFVMIATFKSEDTGILNRSKIKASISTDHGDLEGRRNRVYSTQGA